MTEDVDNTEATEVREVRKLASVQRIIGLKLIPGADAIECAI